MGLKPKPVEAVYNGLCALTTFIDQICQKNPHSIWQKTVLLYCSWYLSSERGPLSLHFAAFWALLGVSPWRGEPLLAAQIVAPWAPWFVLKGDLTREEPKTAGASEISWNRRWALCRGKWAQRDAREVDVVVVVEALEVLAREVVGMDYNGLQFLKMTNICRLFF